MVKARHRSRNLIASHTYDEHIKDDTDEDKLPYKPESALTIIKDNASSTRRSSSKALSRVPS